MTDDQAKCLHVPARLLGHDVPTALGSRWDGFDYFVGASYHKSFVDHCKTTLCLIQSIEDSLLSLNVDSTQRKPNAT